MSAGLYLPSDVQAVINGMVATWPHSEVDIDLRHLLLLLATVVADDQIRDGRLLSPHRIGWINQAIAYAYPASAAVAP